MTQDRLDIQPWMTAAPVRRVLAALGAGEVDVRFVGGAVRNAVMNLPVTEIDLATPDLPVRVTERLTAAHIKAVPTGITHGTVMAVVDGATFEITTLRRDTACDGRHAAVEFTTDWHEDAGRRDFTFNAMSLSPDGTLFDDHGGLDDANAGRVKFVGDAGDRIQEDYLRILRLFRFFAWYGRVPLDATTLEACRRHVGGIGRLSGERLQQELTKLLAAPAPLTAVKLMQETGVLAEVLPQAVDTSVFARLLDLHGADDWLLRLAAILPTDTEVAEAAADHLKLSNAARDRLVLLLRDKPLPDDHADPLQLRRALYELGAKVVGERVLLAWARAGAVASPAPWRALLEAAASWEPKTFPVTGTDVLALGVPPGPVVGQLLAAGEHWWIGAGFTPGRAEILAHLRAVLESKNGSGGVPEPFA